MTRCPWCGAPHNVYPSCGPGKPGRCAWCGAGRDTGRLEQVRWLVSERCITAECARELLDLGSVIQYANCAPVFVSNGVHDAIVRKYESFAEEYR